MANPGELLELIKRMGPMHPQGDPFGSMHRPGAGFNSQAAEPGVREVMQKTNTGVAPPPGTTRLPGGEAEIVQNPDAAKRNSILRILALLGLGGGTAALTYDQLAPGKAKTPGNKTVPSFVDQVSDDEAGRPRIGERLEDALKQKKRTAAPARKAAAPPAMNPQSSLKPTEGDPNAMSPEELDRYFRSGGYRQGVM